LFRTIVERLEKQGEPDFLWTQYLRAMRALCHKNRLYSFEDIDCSLKSIKSMLRSENSEIQKEACWFLSDLLEQHEQMIYKLLAEGSLLTEVLDIFKSEDTTAFYPAMRVLGNLSAINDQTCNQLIDWGILPALTKALYIPQPDYMTAHLEIVKLLEAKSDQIDSISDYKEKRKLISNLIENSENGADLIRRATMPIWEELCGSEETKPTKEEEENYNVRKEAVWICSNLAVNAKQHLYQQEDLLEMIVRNAFEPKAKLAQKESIYLLANITIFDYVHDLDVAENGKIQAKLIELGYAGALISFLDLVIRDGKHRQDRFCYLESCGMVYGSLGHLLQLIVINKNFIIPAILKKQLIQRLHYQHLDLNEKLQVFSVIAQDSESSNALFIIDRNDLRRFQTSVNQVLNWESSLVQVLGGQRIDVVPVLMENPDTIDDGNEGDNNPVMNLEEDSPNTDDAGF
jgi:hypothetical protein